MTRSCRIGCRGFAPWRARRRRSTGYTNRSKSLIRVVARINSRRKVNHPYFRSTPELTINATLQSRLPSAFLITLNKMWTYARASAHPKVAPMTEPLVGFRKQSYKQSSPHPLTRFVRNEVLPNFDCHVVQFPLLAMDGDRIIRLVR